MSGKTDSAARKRKPSPLSAQKDGNEGHKRSDYMKLSSKDKIFTVDQKNNYGHVWTLGDSDTSKEEKYIVNKKAIKKLQKKHKIEMQEKDREIKQQEYIIKGLQATIWQYRNKANKISWLAQAAVDREECISKNSNAKIKKADMEGDDSDLKELDSDPEDDLEMNKVKYACNDGLP